MKSVVQLYRDWAGDYDRDSASNLAIPSGERLILPMLAPDPGDHVLISGAGPGAYPA